jgi:FkbM family methyltransferase
MNRYFLDVGASSGSTFDWFLSRINDYAGWTVFCFEPSPRHWAGLLEKAAQFKNDYRIVLYPFGLGKDDECRTLWMKNDFQGDSFIEHWITNLDSGFQIKTHQVNIGRFILENTEPVDEVHIKLDCEGSEYGILERLLLTPQILLRIKRLMVEPHWIASGSEAYMQSLTAQFEALDIRIESWNL